VIGYIGLGSNLGDREGNLRDAIELMDAEPSITVRRVSSFIDTQPVGGPPQGSYLNAVAEVETALEPRELLDALQRIERSLGRVRTVRWGPRTIDLDIVLLGDAVVDEPGLEIPHPRMHEREFVLRPLCELAPGALHPRLRKTAAELLAALDSRKRGLS